MRRRAFLAACAALGGGAAFRGANAGSGPVRLAAAWDTPDGRHHVGLIEVGAEGAKASASIEVPTRAHGLLAEADGTILALARRPGEWLLRWSPRDGTADWHWNDPERRITGHVAALGHFRYTTEADLDSGAGLVVQRDAHSLAPLAVWQTHGIDPHQLIVDVDGSLLVANGGVPTAAETGRAKRNLAAMDSSLVRLDAATGRLRGQWRLADRRLSIRHLARGACGLVGIALQAEHDDPADRAAAQVLALFDGRRITVPDASAALAGYGGSIVATTGTNSGFAVSCPRAHGIALFDSGGTLRALHRIEEACALAQTGGGLWYGGSGHVGAFDHAVEYRLPGIRLDNHWVAA